MPKEAVASTPKLPLALVLTLVGMLASGILAFGMMQSDVTTLKGTVRHHDDAIDRMAADVAALKQQGTDQNALLRDIRDELKGR